MAFKDIIVLVECPNWTTLKINQNQQTVAYVIIIVLSCLVLGHVAICVDEEGQWRNFDRCLQKFYKITRKHNVQVAQMNEKIWYDVCKAHHVLIQCHHEEISHCPPLMHRFEQDIPAVIGWSVAYINGTCDAFTQEMEIRKLKKNTNGTKACIEMDRRINNLMSCTEKFREVFDDTEKKLDLCTRYYKMRFCHRQEAGMCWPLLQYLEEVREAPDSLYVAMERAKCPNPNDERIRRDPDYWQQRQQFEMKRQEEFEMRKAIHQLKYGKESKLNEKKEPYWFQKIPLWGKISLATVVGSMAVAPFILLFFMMFCR